MEAVAAVGVAAAAVQFFEIAAKALKACSEIRQSAKGETKSNEELGKYTRDLQQIQSSLQTPLSSTGPQTSLVLDIRQECGEITKELLLRLDKLQQHGQKGWRTSLQATLRTMAGSKSIKELEHRHQACQRRFQEALSIEMRNAIADVLQNQGKANESLLKIVLPEMHTRFDQVQCSLAHKAFLDSLLFPDMFARHRNIAPPSTGTYEWIFDQDAEQDKEMQTKLGLFKRWLSSNEPCFWINGKAGSGKSSLVSFIESDKRTEKALKTWSGSHELFIFSFFFWRPGTDLQKSITGLLQSLLYQLVKRKPAAMSGLVSSGGASMHSVWTETTLLRAIAQVLPKYHHDRLFLLVDGLDEFEGQYLRLLDTLFKLQSGTNIKLCLSSRPETALVRRLDSFPSIRLQDINYRDIKLHVAQSLGPYRNQDPRDSDIIDTVQCRSEGIFLWAVLVCKSLVSGYEAGDDEDTIQRRLDATPAGLEPLFSYMFSNIEDVHRESLSIYFRLLRWDVASVALVAVLLHKTPFETLQQYSDECRSTKHRILAQSKGLIEVGDDYWLDDNPDDLRWALIDMSTGQRRTNSVLKTENRDLTRYHTIRLRWVHRSAYDCILNSPSGELAASLRPDDDQDLARETLAAVVWLSKHVPLISVISGELSTMIYYNIKDMIHLSNIFGTDLGKETEQALDELFKALMSSLYVEDGSSLCPPISERLDPTRKRRQTMLPLLDFWGGVASFDDIDKFLLPRFGLMMQSACAGCALELLSSILLIISEQSWDHLPITFHTAIDTLTAIGQSGGRSRAAFGLYSLGAFPDNLGEICYRAMSLLGNDIGEEHARMTHDIFLAVNEASAKVRNGRHDLWYDCTTRLLEFYEAWDIYHGYVSRCGSVMSPLQLQVPEVQFNQHEFIFPASLKVRWPRRTLRLLCLDPKQLSTVQMIKLEPFTVTACFDISEQCSEAIGDLIVDGEFPFGDFVELTGQDRCKQLILNDIWDDPDGQLDAWQRLYVRAFVRKYFKYLRFPGAGK